ncbi:sugar ABC transporter substrate-binding protein [Anaerocolumna sp. AGMB13020]|uniref:sugar ABC transporter substrate-binding protein n=1 Tax=Anaerocolumna sp. AGMB13020 TaxID=3081750 RepID=UPI00295407FF|nr:sugar ABC transporter substrate-binding protein [Anaerocolumna sp. AGMB13020]WOO38323.1 sugar ABC transporter substrate-binding protein [Anaerocolumna sp. AGMB13020]
MKVRLLSCVLVVMLLATSFVGCSSKNDTNTSSDKAATTENGNEAGETESNKTGDKTTVTMWVMPNSGDPENNLKEVLVPFLEQNKDIDVQLTVLDWGSAWTKITTAATSGEGPDITQLGTTQVAAVAAMGALEDLTGIYDKFGGEEAFVPATLPTTQILGAGEERYAAPWFIDTRALFYRKDICEAAGVNPETDFETWDKFKAALEKMKGITVEGKEVAPLMMPGKNDWNVIHNFAPWIWGAGGEFIAADNKTSVVDSEEAYEGVKFYTELATEGLMSMAALEKNSAEVEASFNAGEAAVIISGAYEIATLRREQPELAEKIGTAPFPAGPKGRYAFFGGSGLSVFKSSKNKEAAYRVIEYLMSTDAQVAYQRFCGNLPTVKAAYETEFVSEEPLREAFKTQLDFGKAYPSVAGWGPSETLLQKGLSNVWDNVMGVYGAYKPEQTKEFLKQTASECTIIYNQQ